MGDISSDQLRSLADIARRFTPDGVRTTVEQNIVLRWVRHSDLAELYRALESAQLARPGASNIVDVVACPGTDTCKLGISSSRGLAAELQRRLADKGAELDQAIQDLHIKVSGCFNSCGQHHIADLGFYGVSRKVGGFAVPHFQVVLGGQWNQNAGSYGLPIVAIPSKNVPEVVYRLGERYVRDRNQGEIFQDFVKRTGKLQVRKLLEDLAKVPGYEADSSYFSDWGDPREYSISDIGKGECAGEVVSAVEFDLAAAERQVFEAQVFGEGGDFQKAGETAYGAMLHAARGLITLEYLDVADDPDEIVAQFRTRYFDTEKIFDPFAGPKFANYLFAAHRSSANGHTPETSRRLIEEAQLFIEACHGCFNRMGLESSAATA